MDFDHFINLFANDVNQKGENICLFSKDITLIGTTRT